MTKNKKMRMIESAAHILYSRLLKQDNLPTWTIWGFPFRIDFQKAKCMPETALMLLNKKLVFYL